jgi:hypothetical protein
LELSGDERFLMAARPSAYGLNERATDEYVAATLLIDRFKPQ